MKIAFLTTEYPTEEFFAGGLASYLRRTAYSLASLGHEVTVFCLSDIEGAVDDNGVLVQRVKVHTKVIDGLSRVPFLWRYMGYWSILVPSFLLAFSFLRKHKTSSFEIVQAANYHSCGLVLALVKFIPFLNLPPLVTRVSSYEPLWREGYQKTASRYQLQIEQFDILQMKLSSVVYSPSKILQENLLLKEKIQVRLVEPPFSLPDNIDVTKMPNDIKVPCKYGIFFGSIGTLKGCDRLLNILPRLLNEFEEFSFVFVGIPKVYKNRPFDQVIKEDFESYDDRVVVLPPMRHNKLHPIVKNAEFVVLPSKIDNLPNACMEAMALGKVVIGTYNASFDQLIEHGLNGFLAPQENDEELYKIIRDVYLLDEDSKAKIGHAAIETLERLSPNIATANLVNLFISLRGKK